MGFELHLHHCLVSLSKLNILVQPGKIHMEITENYLLERKESNQTNKLSSSAITCILLRWRVLVKFLVCLILDVPFNNFFSHVGTVFPGLSQY